MEHQAQTRTQELGHDECLELLRHHAFVGRVAFVSEGRPMVLPVNYVADGDSLVFATTPGTKLNALREGAPVAFEVDDSRPLFHAGWSVVVQGSAREITDEADLARLRRGPLRPWALRTRDHWIRISLDQVTGRRIPEE